MIQVHTHMQWYPERMLFASILSAHREKRLVLETRPRIICKKHMRSLARLARIAQRFHFKFTILHLTLLLRSNVSRRMCSGGSLEWTASINVTTDKAIRNLLPIYT